MPYRYVVYVKMRSRLVHVQNGIKHSKIRVAFLKTIHILGKEKSRGSLTVEQYKEYAELKEKADNQRQEVKRLDGEIGNKELILEWRKEAIERTEQDLDKLGTECMEKRGELSLSDRSFAIAILPLTD